MTLLSFFLGVVVFLYLVAKELFEKSKLCIVKRDYCHRFLNKVYN